MEEASKLAQEAEAISEQREMSGDEHVREDLGLEETVEPKPAPKQAAKATRLAAAKEKQAARRSTRPGRRAAGKAESEAGTAGEADKAMEVEMQAMEDLRRTASTRAQAAVVRAEVEARERDRARPDTFRRAAGDLSLNLMDSHTKAAALAQMMVAQDAQAHEDASSQASEVIASGQARAAAIAAQMVA